MTGPRALKDCHSILDLRERARRRLPGPTFDFLDGGAETEITARRNVSAFDDVKLVPRCLRDLSVIKTATRVLGQTLEWPLFCASTGASRLFHVDGELAVARAAAPAGTLYCLSMSSTYSLEEVAAASAGTKVFQLYVSDREVMRELIERCKRAKYSALCLTVDVPVVGKRERDLRSGFGVPPRWSLRSRLNFVRHPIWVLQRLGRRRLTLAHPSERTDARKVDLTPHPSLTWKDVRDIAELWGGPFALKGILSPDDARRAADAGVSAIIVSNHGGRQLDGAAAAIEILPEIVEAVGDRIEVILDGGIRRGVHVLKALALGAKACSVGRPYLYGLSVGGEAGVGRALEILRAEFLMAMQLAGCAELESIDASLVRRFA